MRIIKNICNEYKVNHEAPQGSILDPHFIYLPSNPDLFNEHFDQLLYQKG